MKISMQPMGYTQTNCYIVTIDGKDLIIDPGMGATEWVLKNVKNPIAIFAISPARFVEGFIALAKPFVAQNPERQKNLQEIEKKVKGKNRPERVVFLSKSLTDYEVKIEYSK